MTNAIGTARRPSSQAWPLGGSPCVDVALDPLSLEPDMKRSFLAISLLLAIGSAQAATFTVSRFDDPAMDGCEVNGCSLREAVAAAAAAAGPDTILLAAGDYYLREPGAGLPVTVFVDGETTFQGAGAATTRIRGDGRGTLFNLHQADVAFRDLTLRDGRSSGSDMGGLGGGAIRATLSRIGLRNVVMHGNTAGSGGALHLTDSSLELVATSIWGNKAGNSGGAILAQRTPVRLRAGSVISFNGATSGGAFAGDDEFVADDDCAVVDNTANYGGAFATMGGRLTVRGVKTRAGRGLFEVAGNEASGITNGVPSGYGGAFFAGSPLTLERVQAHGNEANYGGGGIYAAESDLVVRDSLIAANHAAKVGGGAMVFSSTMLLERVSLDGNVSADWAGALSTSGSKKMTLRNVDLYNNQSPSYAGIRNGAPLTLSHVSFWNNVSSTGRDAVEQTSSGSTFYSNSLMLGRCTGSVAAITAAGKNLRTMEPSQSCTGSVGFWPLALARGTYGGLFDITGTTSANSPLVNAGASLYCVSRDARNASRDAACDIGAFEYGAVAP
jgi:hypothetical protein